MAIGAVVFDLYVTLTDWDAERRRPELVHELAGAMGVEPGALASLMRATFTDRATGRLGDNRSSAEFLAARLGRRLDGDQLRRIAALRLDHARQTLAPRPGVLDVLRQLRRDGYQVGVLTDCTAEAVELWPSLPYAAVVDAVTFSCEVGVRKPHPAGYRDIAGKLGVAAAACLYVGDGGSSELSGATAAGMTAVLLETPFGADVRYDAEVDWTGRSVAHLDQLGGVLAELRRG